MKVKSNITGKFYDSIEAALKDSRVSEGDTVKILDIGKFYPTYRDFFFENNLSVSWFKRWKKGCVTRGEKNRFKVLYIGSHSLRQETKVAVIESIKDKSIYLIDIRGVKKVKNNEDVNVGDIVTIGKVTFKQVILKPDEDYFKKNKIPYEYALKFAWDMLPDKTSKFNVVMMLPDGFCLIVPILMEDREAYLLHKDTLVVTTAI